MSPEICAKQKYDGPATDVWAAGILLYTILFGSQPFKAQTEPELYKKIIKGQFKMPKIIEENGIEKFEGFPEIRDIATIKNLLADLLNVREESRIKTGEVLRKYASWFDVDIDLTA